VGCYSSSPLKQNLVPRFLSIVVRGAETKLELGLNGCSSSSPVKIWVASKTCFCWRCRSSSFGKVDGWRVDVAESILSKSCRDTFKVSGVRLSSMPKKIFRELEGFSSSQIEILKSRGFSGSFYCLGGCRFLHAYWWSLWLLVLRLEAWCWCRPLVSSLHSSEDGRQEYLCFDLDRHANVDLVLYVL
jgi:hypothetical protein